MTDPRALARLRKGGVPPVPLVPPAARLLGTGAPKRASVGIEVPVLETGRLVLREPRMTDMAAFAAFMDSPRARFVGGPGRSFGDCARAFGHIAGLWLLRGYGTHVLTLKDGTILGHAGIWHPATWPEPEFGWCLWDGASEGNGYVTEAMQAVMAWTWADVGLATVVSYIDPGNFASMRVAERLGGRIDADAPSPGDDPILVYRYHAPEAA